MYIHLVSLVGYIGVKGEGVSEQVKGKWADFFWILSREKVQRMDAQRTHLSMLRIWLCSARKDTGESMASRLLAHSRTT